MNWSRVSLILVLSLLSFYTPITHASDAELREAERRCAVALAPSDDWLHLGRVALRENQKVRAYQALNRGITLKVLGRRQIERTPIETDEIIAELSENGSFEPTIVGQLSRTLANSKTNTSKIGIFGGADGRAAPKLWMQNFENWADLHIVDLSQPSRVIRAPGHYAIEELENGTLLTRHNGDGDTFDFAQLDVNGELQGHVSYNLPTRGHRKIEADRNGLIFIHTVEDEVYPRSAFNADRSYPSFKNIDTDHDQNVFAMGNDGWVTVENAEGRLEGTTKGEMVDFKRVVGRQTGQRRPLFQQSRPFSTYAGAPFLFLEQDRIVWAESHGPGIKFLPISKGISKRVSIREKFQANQFMTYKNPRGSILRAFSGQLDHAAFFAYDLDGNRLAKPDGSPSFADLKGIETHDIFVFPDGRYLFHVKQVADYDESWQELLQNQEVRDRGRYQIYSHDGKFLETLKLVHRRFDRKNVDVRVLSDGRIALFEEYGHFCLYEWKPKLYYGSPREETLSVGFSDSENNQTPLILRSGGFFTN